MWDLMHIAADMPCFLSKHIVTCLHCLADAAACLTYKPQRVPRVSGVMTGTNTFQRMCIDPQQGSYQGALCIVSLPVEAGNALCATQCSVVKPALILSRIHCISDAKEALSNQLNLQHLLF